MMERFRPDDMGGNMKEPRESGEVLPPGLAASMVGNVATSEQKCLLVGLMSSKNPKFTERERERIFEGFDSVELHDLVMKAQGGTDVWQVHRYNPMQACERSLVPSGMVEWTDESESRVSISHGGNDFGFAFAGLMLAWSLRWPGKGLSDVLGRNSGGKVPARPNWSTSDSLEYVRADGRSEGRWLPRSWKEKNWATEHRLEIYRQLLAHVDEGMSVGELEAALGVQRGGLSNHADELIRQGFVDYATEDNSRGNIMVGYVVVDEEARFRRSGGEQARLPERVYEYIKARGGMVTYQEIMEYLGDEVVVNDMRGAVNRLVKRGVLVRVGLAPGQTSNIRLRSEYVPMIVDLVARVDRFAALDPGVLEEGEVSMVQVLEDPLLIGQLMVKAREASATVDRWAYSDMEVVLLSLLRENPGLTREELYQALAERGWDGRKNTLSEHLMVAEADGLVHHDEDGFGGSFRFFVNEESDEQRDDLG